jgi:hypothetical protein
MINPCGFEWKLMTLNNRAYELQARLWSCKCLTRTLGDCQQHER